MLTQTYLKELFNYNTETGSLQWKIRKRGVKLDFSIAGTLHKAGYISISINNKLYRAHRLVWLYHYGTFPIGMLDHINGIRYDNRIENLRQATRQENNRNSKIHSSNTSRYKGVCWVKSKNKWKAYCRLNGKCKHIGYFLTAEEASDAYQNFVKEFHGEFYKDTRSKND